MYSNTSQHLFAGCKKRSGNGIITFAQQNKNRKFYEYFFSIDNYSTVSTFPSSS